MMLMGWHVSLDTCLDLFLSSHLMLPYLFHRSCQDKASRLRLLSSRVSKALDGYVPVARLSSVFFKLKEQQRVLDEAAVETEAQQREASELLLKAQKRQQSLCDQVLCCIIEEGGYVTRYHVHKVLLDQETFLGKNLLLTL